jgi:hypothetical protein
MWQKKGWEVGEEVVGCGSEGVGRWEKGKREVGEKNSFYK